MSSLISSSDKESFQNSYLDFFDTFKENIVIYKTPKKTFVNTASPSAYGYGEKSNVNNFTLTPVSGVYPAIVTYADEQKIERLSDANEILQEGQVSIDIKKDAKDFIESGVTTLIDINGSKFVLWSSARKKNFLDLEMYSYKLKVTN